MAERTDVSDLIGVRVIIKRDGDPMNGSEGELRGRSAFNSSWLDILVGERVVQCHNIFVRRVVSNKWIFDLPNG